MPLLYFFFIFLCSDSIEEKIKKINPNFERPVSPILVDGVALTEFDRRTIRMFRKKPKSKESVEQLLELYKMWAIIIEYPTVLFKLELQEKKVWSELSIFNIHFIAELDFKTIIFQIKDAKLFPNLEKMLIELKIY